MSDENILKDQIAHTAVTLGVLRGLLEKAIYPTLISMTMTAWKTREPVSFEDRMSGMEQAVEIGDAWGEALFDCAWFRFAADLSGIDLNQPLVARIDINGELLVVDNAGIPVRGLTNGSSTFDYNLGMPAKTVFPIPADWIQDGQVTLWADAAFNDLFGFVKGEGKVKLAEIATVREEVRALYYDVEVLEDYLKCADADAPLVHELIAMTPELDSLLNASLESDAIAEAAALVAPLLAQTGANPLEISAVGHAHLDLAWLWPIRESYRKGARTFATALENMKVYPEFIFGASQPQLFQWMKERYPELYVRIKQAHKKGQLDVQGAMWVEADQNVSSGEALVRQILYGRQFWQREFYVDMDYVWLPDTFGYNAQLPQIFKKSGIEYFMTMKLAWNTVNRWPHHSFNWSALDGSTVLAHILPEETYNGPAAPRSLHKIDSDYAQKDVSNHALMLYGIGDGGGGPGMEHLERLRRVSGLGNLPRVQQRTVREFFGLLEQDRDQFPKHQGELYLEKHQGTFTTQGQTKKWNRTLELALRELEWGSVWAEQVAGMPYPKDELDAIWKEVLLYQFHDILPGSSIKRVYDECNARYAELYDQVCALSEARFQAIANRTGLEGTLAFNALPWERTEWIKVDQKWQKITVPGLGYALVDESRSSLYAVPMASGTHLENDFLRVDFNDNGTIKSVYDKKRALEMLRGAGNVFMVYEDSGDAWDMSEQYHDTGQPMVFVSRHFRTDGPMALIESKFFRGESSLIQRVILRAGSPLLEFETEVDWHTPKTNLRTAFPLAISADEACCEIQFGSVMRPIHNKDSWAEAKAEIPAQQWIDISDDTEGVALINDCKYGHRVKDNTLELALLRCVPHPGGAIINKDDQAGVAEHAEYTDLGRHVFRYALLPHAQGPLEAGVVPAARRFNTPLRMVEVEEAAGESAVPLITVNSTEIDITAIKRAEDGGGWIVRFYNTLPEAVTTEIVFSGPITLESCNLMEVTDGEIASIEDGKATLRFGAFEIKTVRIT